MPLQWFLQWWNLAFIVPFLLALFYLLIYAASGFTFGDADPTAAADAPGDIDADAHVEVGADADVDGDLDNAPGIHVPEGDADHAGDHGLDDGHGHDAEQADQEADTAFAFRALGWLGLGRVPLSIVLMLLMISWGAIGFLTNYLLSSRMPWEWTVVLVSLPAAAVGSITLTRYVVRALARWMPTTETSARPRAALVASSGEALYTIDQTFGMAAVRTREGDLFQPSCRTYEGRPSIAKGKPVLLVDYDAKRKLFYVIENDVDL